MKIKGKNNSLELLSFHSNHSVVSTRSFLSPQNKHSKSTSQNTTQLSVAHKSKASQPKEQTPKALFYHHTSIHKVSFYQQQCQLSNNYGWINIELPNSRLKEILQSFKIRVKRYLETLQKNRSFHRQSTYIVPTSPSQSSLRSFIVQNSYNYDPIYEPDLKCIILIKAQNRQMSRNLKYRTLENQIWKKLHPFLNNVHHSYDLKQRVVLIQFAEMIEKMRTLSYKILLPEKLQFTGQDYNDYYSSEQQSTSIKRGLDLENIFEKMINNYFHDPIDIIKNDLNQISFKQQVITEQSINEQDPPQTQKTDQDDQQNIEYDQDTTMQIDYPYKKFYQANNNNTRVQHPRNQPTIININQQISPRVGSQNTTHRPQSISLQIQSSHRSQLSQNSHASPTHQGLPHHAEKYQDPDYYEQTHIDLAQADQVVTDEDFLSTHKNKSPQILKSPVGAVKKYQQMNEQINRRQSQVEQNQVPTLDIHQIVGRSQIVPIKIFRNYIQADQPSRKGTYDDQEKTMTEESEFSSIKHCESIKKHTDSSARSKKIIKNISNTHQAKQSLQENQLLDPNDPNFILNVESRLQQRDNLINSHNHRDWLDYMLNSENIFELDIVDHKIANFDEATIEKPEIEDPTQEQIFHTLYQINKYSRTNWRLQNKILIPRLQSLMKYLEVDPYFEDEQSEEDSHISSEIE